MSIIEKNKEYSKTQKSYIVLYDYDKGSCKTECIETPEVDPVEAMKWIQSWVESNNNIVGKYIIEEQVDDADYDHYNGYKMSKKLYEMNGKEIEKVRTEALKADGYTYVNSNGEIVSKDEYKS
tara:strand:+ start:280 stop:648 length:369 start_codon:yes stop_codon:yes gene_type:complete